MWAITIASKFCDLIISSEKVAYNNWLAIEQICIVEILNFDEWENIVRKNKISPTIWFDILTKSALERGRVNDKVAALIMGMIL